MRPLSKSEFVAGIECVRKPWLDRYRLDLAVPKSEAILDRIQTGARVGELARLRYPGGIFALVGDDPIVLMDSRDCLFEPRFEFDGRLARVDVLWRGEHGWVIDEVKSSTVQEPGAIKDEHLWDLAFQIDTLERGGIPVESGRLILVDPKYVWGGGEYCPSTMLGIVDLTTQCRQIQGEVRELGDLLIEVLASDKQPVVVTNTHCKKCDYFDYCHASRPKHDLIYLPNARAATVTKLREKGYESIDQIPIEERLTPTQTRVRDVVRAGKPFVGEGLKAAIESVAFPAVFVDYESSNPAFPVYAGTRPYQQICFQWSSHWMDGPDAEPVHSEFLPVDASDPRVEFCARLWEVVKDAKSIVHYTPFEITQVKAMVADGIPLAAEILEAFQTRSVDLEKIVDDYVYLEAFMGRTSIKVVLPALVPHLSYKDMAIADGLSAAAGYRRMVSGTLTLEEVAELRADLLAYCKQDTLAMVEVYRALRRMTNP